METNANIPICAGGARILAIKDPKKRVEEWDKLIKAAYSEAEK